MRSAGRRPHFRYARPGILALAVLASPVAVAGGGMAGGATEVTQLANHAELAASVVKQAEMVEQNIQAQIARLQNLVQVPGSMIDQSFSPYRSQLTNYQSLYGAVTQMREAANATNSLF